MKYGPIGLSVLVGIGIFLFWAIGYPHALSYHEQNQLFLWTWDYFTERLSVAGGLADWLGELKYYREMERCRTGKACASPLTSC